MIKAIYFDFDGVIVDSSDLKHKLLVQTAGEMAPGIDKLLDEALNTELIGAERARVAQWVVQRSAGLVSEASFLGSFANALEAAIPSMSVTEGFKEFLSARDKQLFLAIVSNAPEEDIRRILRLNGIDEHEFYAICGFSQLGKAAEARSLISNMGLQAHDVLFVGDMPSDLQVAKEVGMRFLRIKSHAGERCDWPSPDYDVRENFLGHPLY